MPELDGLDATRAIRALGGEVRETRIVALTANAMDEDRRRCLEAGGGADEAEFDAAVDAFRRHYAVVNGDCTEVYPGVVPALAAQFISAYMAAPPPGGGGET